MPIIKYSEFPTGATSRRHPPTPSEQRKRRRLLASPSTNERKFRYERSQRTRSQRTRYRRTRPQRTRSQRTRSTSNERPRRTRSRKTPAALTPSRRLGQKDSNSRAILRVNLSEEKEAKDFEERIRKTKIESGRRKTCESV